MRTAERRPATHETASKEPQISGTHDTGRPRPAARTASAPTAPLIVDVRPGVAWVSQLPATWTTTAERLILLLLADDADDDIAEPGIDNLIAWAGMSRSSTFAALASLAVATTERPALIERVDANGQPIPLGHVTRRGEHRRYRLRFEATNHTPVAPGLPDRVHVPTSPVGGPGVAAS